MKKEKLQPKIKICFYFLIVVFSFSFLFFPFFAQAQDVNNLMINLVAPTPLIRADLIKVIFTAIQYLLSFLGVVAVLILIYGGFLWMTARGDEEKVRKAKKTLINGLIGLVIILLSYAIVHFVVGPLLRAWIEEEIDIERRPGIPGLPRGAQYLVITSKYPKEGETVPRNTKIIVTFNQNLDPTTVRLARPKENRPTETTCLDENNNPNWTVAIQNNQNEFIDGSLKVVGNSLIFIPKENCPPPLDTFKCEKLEEGICFLNFRKPGCCSCFEQGSDYKITLIARRGTRIGLKGLRPFGNTMYKDEIWKFNVGPYLDARAPEVETNLPQGERVPRNTGILITFTKEIDPSTITLYNPNCLPGSPNCNRNNCGIEACLNYAVDDINKATVKIYSVDDEGNPRDPIPGFFEKFSTKSFFFRPSQRCGPLGSNLYHCRCFPELTKIKVELISGEEGIRGVNCVSLDCRNQKCSWIFKASDQIDIEPPKVKEVFPENNAEEVDRLLKDGIQAIFDEDMDSTSINEDTFILRPETPPREIRIFCSRTGWPCTDKSAFIPFKVLKPDTLYSPLIYGTWERKSGCQLDPDFNFGVKDLAGNAMFGNYIWSFKTGWIVAGGEPYIDWVSPRQGPKGECVTIHGYNLGCCGPYECRDDFEAQKKKIDIVVIEKKKKLTCTSVPPGQSGNTSMWNDIAGRYDNADVLTWEEINKRKPCGPPPKPPCPGLPFCTPLTCPANCPECRFCSDPNPANCGSCYCLMPAYSPENELVIVVPEGATNRSPNDPGEIKVVPAQ